MAKVQPIKIELLAAYLWFVALERIPVKYPCTTSRAIKSKQDDFRLLQVRLMFPRIRL